MSTHILTYGYMCVCTGAGAGRLDLPGHQDVHPLLRVGAGLRHRAHARHAPRHGSLPPVLKYNYNLKKEKGMPQCSPPPRQKL